MAEQPRFAFCSNCVENLIRFRSTASVQLLVPKPHIRLFFAFSTSYRATLRYASSRTESCSSSVL